MTVTVCFQIFDLDFFFSIFNRDQPNRDLSPKTANYIAYTCGAMQKLHCHTVIFTGFKCASN